VSTLLSGGSTASALALVAALGACRSGGGVGSGPTANPCATAIYCDDFEGYPAGQAPGGSWTPRPSAGATASVDETQFRSGSKSVKLTTPAGDATKTAFIQLAGSAVFPVNGNAFYGRMMFRLDTSPAATNPPVHWTFIQGGGLLAGQSHRAVYRYGGQHPVMQGSTFVGNQLMANYETPDSYSGNGPSSDCWKHSSQVVVPAGTWACAEWQFDGPGNTMRFWLDGAAVDSLTVAGVGQGCVHQPASYPWTAPTFDRLDLGWESYQPDDARTLWIDDVAISTTRIGCP
jgi:hypothetical protein